MTAGAPAVASRRRRRPRGRAVAAGDRPLILPAGLWYLFLLVLPIAIVLSVQLRRPGRDRRLRRRVHVRQLRRSVPQRLDRSSRACTCRSRARVLCLLVGLPLAYFIATRAGKRKSLLIILLVIPFWTSFLIRTYSWLILLGRDGLAGWFVDV